MPDAEARGGGILRAGDESRSWSWQTGQPTHIVKVHTLLHGFVIASHQAWHNCGEADGLEGVGGVDEGIFRACGANNGLGGSTGGTADEDIQLARGPREDVDETLACCA